MSGATEVKPGMYAEDLPEDERRREYAFSTRDLAEIQRRIVGTLSR